MSSFLCACFCLTLFGGVGSGRREGPRRVMAGEAGGPAKAKAAGAPARAAVNGACALITRAEVQAILGEPIDEPTSGLGDSCHYGHKPDKALIVGTELRKDETASKFEVETKMAADAIGARLKPAPGLGERAVWIGDISIAVLQHGKALSVTQPSGKVGPEKLEALVRKALTRF